MVINVSVKRRDDELFEKFLKRFYWQVRKSGVLKEVQETLHYTKPSERRHSKKLRRKKKLEFLHYQNRQLK